MATKAIHKLGDISSDSPDLCVVYDEDAENYIGNWITGFGFIGVKFPKATTKELTEEEKARYSGQWFQIGSQPPWQLPYMGSEAVKKFIFIKDLAVGDRLDIQTLHTLYSAKIVEPEKSRVSITSNGEHITQETRGQVLGPTHLNEKTGDEFVGLAVDSNTSILLADGRWMRLSKTRHIRVNNKVVLE